MNVRPIVALIGRPNVGKSTLFNRLIGRREAIVSFEAGTTRDRHFGMLEWLGHTWTIIDTAGIMPDVVDTSIQPELDLAIDEQINLAMQEADLLCFVVDGQEGIHADDLKIIGQLRKQNKPIVILANKSDNPGLRAQSGVFEKFGIKTIFPISAIHGTGIGDFMDYLIETLPYKDEVKDANRVPKVSVLGRPNVGKSTLINRISGQKRAVVSSVPGTTRDIVEIPVKRDDMEFSLVDTAGIRRRGKIEAGIEKFSLFRTLRAINESDLVVLLLTIEEAPTRGDAHVAMYAQEAGKDIIIALNKADLAYDNLFKQDPHKRHNVGQRFLRRFVFLQRLPYYFISAQSGQGVDELLKAVEAKLTKKESSPASEDQ